MSATFAANGTRNHQPSHDKIVALFLSVRCCAATCVTVTLCDMSSLRSKVRNVLTADAFHDLSDLSWWRMDKCPFMLENSREISILMFDSPILFTVFTWYTGQAVVFCRTATLATMYVVLCPSGNTIWVQGPPWLKFAWERRRNGERRRGEGEEFTARTRMKRNGNEIFYWCLYEKTHII